MGTAPKPIIDFDQMIEEDIPIRLLKKDRVLKPVSLKTYAKFINGFNLLHAKPDDTEKLIDGYYEIFSAVIEPFDREEIHQMRIEQIAALFMQVYERISGKSESGLLKTGSSEKKN